jgi:hypothetical protein
MERISERTSLHSFAKAHNLPKSSLHRKAQTLGIDTSNGLAPRDQQRLLAEFSSHQEPTTAVQVYTVPISNIQVLTSDETSTLDTLAAEFVQPVRFKAIEMNGRQTELLSDVEQLANIARTMKAQNDSVEAELQQRNQKLETTKAIAAQISKVIGAQVKRNDALVEKSQELTEEETELKKLLAKLQRGL